ncbi:deoxyribonuclease tatdn1-related [Anaeramoeba ignava]|uniref:Deoxyribonuclease tatdn1-related n=1 Tax=Anaeramoeba ignava TaxID=1746090 RepID=A0A9Q0LY16_ANAIG|nr:deoxyribonuclease tatdn1-related [Anaeramoeba ignava]
MKKFDNLRFIDIGANLTDQNYYGIYQKKKVHESDLESVFERSLFYGVEKTIVTGATLNSSQKAFELCKQHKTAYFTCGVHPSSAHDLKKDGNEEEYLAKMLKLIQESQGLCVAIGEMGLDYDRLWYTTKEEQKEVFQKQFELVDKINLPLFLHSRNATKDFVDILQKNRSRFKEGVVHSFTGPLEELKALLDLNMYIGVNGCSLKQKENLEMVKEIPIERMMLDTDCPYCEIRQSHPTGGFRKTVFEAVRKEKFIKGKCVKGRIEPCFIRHVAEAIAVIKNQSIEDISKIIFENTMKVFFPKEFEEENQKEK